MSCSKLAKQLTIFSLNCRSVKNTILSVAEIVMLRDIDILAMTETWLGPSGVADVFSELASPGYNILHVARPASQEEACLLFLERFGVKTVNRKVMY